MLTRIGATAGPEWMRRLVDGSMRPEDLRRRFRRILLFFAILQATALVVADVAAFRAPRRRGATYNSETRIGSLPLLSVGGRAHGVFAFGGLATGVVALGGVAAGVVSYGGLGLRVLSVGGLSLGILALGGGAVGWRAFGGVAVGAAAFGGLAIGRHAYAGGGVAFGTEEASGKQKETLFG